MATKKKLLQAAAGSAGGGGGLDVSEVFSTYLYEGNGSTNTINNGIDVSGEGGLVWIKNRQFADNHMLIDTERGNEYLVSNETFAEAGTGTTFETTSTGFKIVNSSFDDFNANGEDYASWTFRKAPKFFDVVTFSTTTGSSTPITVNHNLGSVPGMIIVKTTNIAGDWFVFHRSLGSTKYLDLGSTDQAQTGGTSKWASAPTDTSFTLGGDFVQNATYVAYLFAHNDGDGDFGPDSDADIIKCGSYTGNSTIGHTIDLGFEAQWVLVRSTSNLRKWMLYDVMRGMPVDSNGAALYPNSNDDEEALQRIGASNVGFQLTSTDSMVNVSGETYIYIAIRRGPMAVPTDATDVFDIAFDGALDTNKPYVRSDLNYVDMTINNSRTGTTYHRIGSRLTQGRYLDTNFSSAETTSSYYQYDFQNGWFDLAASNSINTNGISWMWKRAPSFCDVVAYTGNGTAGRTVSHNLGVAPEMIWVKHRASSVNWNVYHKDLDATNPSHKYLMLDSADGVADNVNRWNDTEPTESVFSVGTSGGTNVSAGTYIAYLFASLDGVSKVGSYTGNGTSQNIDCGFSSGARFVLIKSSTQATEWFLFDTERGIVSGNDPALLLDTTDAEYTSYDLVDPYSSGFAVNYVGAFNGTNTSGQTYIFYAIA